MAREANERIIEEATGTAPSRGFFEGEDEYAARLETEASERVIEDSTGDAPSKGWFESDRDYNSRVVREAHERIIADSTGQPPSQKFFESPTNYETRVRMKANESVIERYSGQPPKQRFLESDHDYRSRISDEARELRALNSDAGSQRSDDTESAGAGGGGGGIPAEISIFFLVPLIVIAIPLLFICPALWLAWRIFRKKRTHTDQDAQKRGAGLVTLAIFMVLFGITCAQGAVTCLTAVMTSWNGPESRWGLLAVFGLTASWSLSLFIGAFDILRKSKATTVAIVMIILGALSIFGYFIRKQTPRYVISLPPAQNGPPSRKTKKTTAHLNVHPVNNRHPMVRPNHPQTGAEDPMRRTTADAGKPQTAARAVDSVAVVSPVAVLVLSPEVADSLLVRKQMPNYPPIAKAAGISGTVQLEAAVSQTGTVTQVSAITGPSMLYQTSIDAVRTWRYRPYTVGGEPIAFKTKIEIHFQR